MRTIISRFFILLLITFIAQETLAQKRIYIAPDDHTDYMWKGNEQQYQSAFLEMTDYYLNQMDATAGSPSPHQARWNADGSFWMWTYQKNRTQAQFQRLINRIKDGHFSMPLNALVLSNGGTPAEAVLRGMLYPGMIEREYNVDFPIAIAMENQTLPYGLSSLWAGSGARYSWKGVCGCATHVPHLSNREREIYYLGGRDQSRVLMKWNSLLMDITDDNTSIGAYAEGRDPTTTVNYVDNNPDFAARYPFPVIGVFGKGEDDLMTLDDEFVIAAQQLSTAKRQVFVSNQVDFFKDFETHHGGQLETFAASYGNEWELYIASMAEVSARIKRAVEKLRTAEALAAYGRCYAGLINQSFRIDSPVMLNQEELTAVENQCAQAAAKDPQWKTAEAAKLLVMALRASQDPQKNQALGAEVAKQLDAWDSEQGYQPFYFLAAYWLATVFVSADNMATVNFHPFAPPVKPK